MAIKWKNSSAAGMAIVLLCSALAGGLMCNRYPMFRQKAQDKIEEMKQALAQEEVEQGENEPEVFTVDEDFERYLLSSICYLNYEMTPGMDAYDYLTQGYDRSKLTEEEQGETYEAAARLMKNMRNQYVTGLNMDGYDSYAKGIDRVFGSNMRLKDAIYDTSNDAEAYQYYQSGIIISYDSRGIPSVRKQWNLDYDEAELLQYLSRASLNRLIRDNGMEDYADEELIYETVEVSETEESTVASVVTTGEMESGIAILSQMPLPVIQNATFAFGIGGGEFAMEDYWEDNQYWLENQAYLSCGMRTGAILIMLVMAVLALILQHIPSLGLQNFRIFHLSTEIGSVVGWTGVVVSLGLIMDRFGIWTLQNGEDSLAGILESDFGLGGAASAVALVLLWLMWSCFAFGWYWITAWVIPYIVHPIRTILDQTLIFRFFGWLKKKWIGLWNWATDVELDENLTRQIWKVVGINGLIAMFLCCIWFGGIVGVVIYSILLYVLVKKKCAEIQEDYKKLLHVTRTIAEGDLNVSTDEDMGLFNATRDELAAIQKGFQKAVDEEVRSRNMKTELITNVSHDLKTPLTAIITYVDLLKKEDLTDEERKEYVETLEKKSQRLKILIEDLFEISKATTDNIVLNYDMVDLVNLIKEVRLENEDKIQESTLDFRWTLPEEKCILRLDPQRTFRIIDNLIQNILKYSMASSRVYIAVKEEEETVVVSFKNMSAEEMNFTPEEIAERFVRGDLSRNTEGSGLGLAIAQSFTELQGGEFKIETDGDLFKVTLKWKKGV